MTLKELMKLQADFDSEHESSFAWGRSVEETSPQVLEHSVVCLVGEVGEFANILKKISRGDMTYDGARSGLQDELTDIFIYVMQIANQMGTDLQDSYLAKLSKNRERFKRYERPRRPELDK